MEILDLQQNTPEWINFRKTGIGASDCPILMGVSPYSTPYKLWRSKMYDEDLIKSHPGMKRGHDLEPIAREEFIKATGIGVNPVVCVSDKRKWQYASLDGLSNDETILIEIKCPNKEIFADIKRGNIPEHYLWQIQHQLCVTECEQAFLCAYNGKELIIREVLPDEQMIEELLLKEEEFWYKNIMLFDAPPMTKEDEEEVYAENNSPEFEIMSYEWKRLCDLEEAIKKQKEDLKKQMIQACNNVPTKGCGITVYFQSRKGNVNYEAIPELMGVDLEPYRAPSKTVWIIKT